MSVTISLNALVKKYNDNTVIPELNAFINSSEFFTLLGPSGCGKTTLLRMIAGFNSIEGGVISFNDKVINNIPAHKRNIGMVFQNYAIFPHITVQENVEYGLKLRKLPKSEIKKRAADILKTVKIEKYADTLPENLSGGQQQRVSLARAIVIHPDVLLMDEPLSNLDAKLRIEMRSAIRDIQKQVGITTVYVTHDQEEALAISDRIAIMNDGVIQQINTPENIYTRPYNTFVSTFIGSSNIFSATIQKNNTNYKVTLANNFHFYMDNIIDCGDSDEIIISIRPEEFIIDENGINFIIKNRTFLGNHITYELVLKNDTDSNMVQFSQYTGNVHKSFNVGDTIKLVPNTDKINAFSKDGTKTLIKGVISNV